MPYREAFKNGLVQHESARLGVDGDECAPLDAPTGFKVSVKPLGTVNYGSCFSSRRPWQYPSVDLGAGK